MAYPPFYSSFTPPFYSFHHQPGVINFTHLCLPCPTLRPQSLSSHLHYQELIPPLPYSQPQPPDPSANVKSLLHQILQSQQTFEHTFSAFATEVSNLSTQLTPATFTHTSGTFPFVSPISSFNQPPPIYNPYNLSHLNPYQEPLHLPDFPSPIAAYGSNVSTTANGRSQEITATEKQSQEDTLQDPPSISQNPVKQLGPPPPQSSDVRASAEGNRTPEIDENRILTESLNSRSPKERQGSSKMIVPVEALFSRLYFAFISFAPDRLCSSCFDVLFLGPAPIGSSSFKLGARVLLSDVPSPEKRDVNTISATPPEHSILVFDPGGSNVFNTKKKLERAVTIFVFKTEKMAVNTISATPPDRSSFVFDPGGNSTIALRRCE